MFGIDALIWVGLALSVVSFGIGLLGAKKPSGASNAKPAGADEFDFPQFEEGAPQVVVFGDVWIEDGFVLWYGNHRNEPIMSSGGGGK